MSRKARREQTEVAHQTKRTGSLRGKAGSAPALPSLVGALGQVPLPLNASREWDNELYYEGLPQDGDKVQAQPTGDRLGRVPEYEDGERPGGGGQRASAAVPERCQVLQSLHRAD